MKKMFLLSLGIFYGSSLLAGTSDQDYRIKDLRDQFLKAHAPTVAELYLGQNWLCNQSMAERDNFHYYDSDPIYNFVSQGSDFKHGSDLFYQFHSVKNYKLTNLGLVGFSVKPEDDRFTYMFGEAIDLRLRHQEVIRITDKGNLIAEFIFDKNPEHPSNYEASISDPSKKVHLYTWCSDFFVR